ncbi:MAG: acylphosphatase [bacterium]|nr:acylphosphatase [bacterium]
MTTPSPIALRVIFRGHVQGVGFRYTVLRLAQPYRSLTGYVRNQPDGSVEVFAQGPHTVVEAFIQDICHGPHQDYIREVERHPTPPSDRFTEFRIAF